MVAVPTRCLASNSIQNRFKNSQNISSEEKDGFDFFPDILNTTKETAKVVSGSRKGHAANIKLDREEGAKHAHMYYIRIYFAPICSKKCSR